MSGFFLRLLKPAALLHHKRHRFARCPEQQFPVRLVDTPAHRDLQTFDHFPLALVSAHRLHDLLP